MFGCKAAFTGIIPKLTLFFHRRIDFGRKSLYGWIGFAPSSLNWIHLRAQAATIYVFFDESGFNLDKPP